MVRVMSSYDEEFRKRNVQLLTLKAILAS